MNAGAGKVRGSIRHLTRRCLGWLAHAGRHENFPVDREGTEHQRYGRGFMLERSVDG
ncbi:MAG TPA: hypothetical protein VN416_06515 [Desulfomonilia bacterium]|nr:hypothetical protein [Desulfomonilia bacterium]